MDGVEGMEVPPTVVEGIAGHLTQPTDPLDCPAAPPELPASSGRPARPVPDDVRVAVACRDAGFNEAVPAGTLTAHAFLDEPQRLVAAVNGATPPADGVWNCAADSGATDLIVFTGPVTGTTTVAVTRTGCRWMHSSFGGTLLTPDAVTHALSALDAPLARLTPAA